MDFVKAEGGGNDFILIDRTEDSGTINWPDYVPSLCTRKTGIGSDGVLVLESCPGHDFMMRIFNPDGSEVEMCGNGARCSAEYYFDKKSAETVQFNTLAGIMKAEKGSGGQVRLSVPAPTQVKLDIMIRLGDREISVSHVNTGVSHAIVETEHLESLDVADMGRKIRYNDEFAPAGTNADFVQVTGKDTLSVRTYERGVEAETLACGTGVMAAAVIESIKGRIDPPVRVKTRGGEVMTVYFKISGQDDLISRVYDVKLEGRVNRIYTGCIEIERFGPGGNKNV